MLIPVTQIALDFAGPADAFIRVRTSTLLMRQTLAALAHCECQIGSKCDVEQ
jgi:hypothetical protein